MSTTSQGYLNEEDTIRTLRVEIERLTRQRDEAHSVTQEQLSYIRRLEKLLNEAVTNRDALLAAVTEYVKELDNRFCDVSMRVTLRGRLRSLVLAHEQTAASADVYPHPVGTPLGGSDVSSMGGSAANEQIEPESEPIHGVGLYPV